jgi:outer membrane protease
LFLDSKTMSNTAKWSTQNVAPTSLKTQPHNIMKLSNTGVQCKAESRYYQKSTLGPKPTQTRWKSVGIAALNVHLLFSVKGGHVWI